MAKKQRSNLFNRKDHQPTKQEKVKEIREQKLQEKEKEILEV